MPLSIPVTTAAPLVDDDYFKGLREMSESEFPAFHGARRAIVVLKKNDIRLVRNDPTFEGREFLYDDEAFVLEYPPSEDYLGQSKALENIVYSDLVRPGAVLVQSPYEKDSYVELERAAEVFAIEKVHHFSRLCQLLGATFVETEQVEIKREGESSIYGAKGNIGPVKGDVKITATADQSLTRKFIVTTTMDGREADIDAAERFLRSKNLLGDRIMRSLIEQRADSTNPIREQRVTLSLSNETKSTLGVVGKLNLPSKFGVSAEYKNVATRNEEYSLTLLVKFES
ncbi:hypothetical protein [Stutzerimonas stutzeri]|uniref:hypothetical protein n=1 Tax=Stutzerimonas stutzeri TaxID=316 RepID=UPI00210DD3A1|nr:hypothetical protein [Stutzerimonas stutzeri]MCQ4256505.1 hypothetical protein [Stutzerimonas stutzeri]